MITILYVDDEPYFLELGKAFLEINGIFSVDITTSALEALKLIPSKKYDAIISDYQMPLMDGIELLKRVRESGNNIPFILFTGRGREEVVIQALNEGADYYLQKGGDTQSLFVELSHKLRLAVQKRQAEAALEASEERYRSVVEDQTELISRFTPDGKLTFINDAYCRYFHLEKDHCLGQPYSLHLTPDNAIKEKQHLLSLTPENPVDLIEHRIEMPDGTIRWQLWNDRAIFDTSGQLIEYQSVGRDITKQKEAEEKLLESEHRFAAFMNNLPATVFIKDDRCVNLFVNTSMKELFSARQWIGKSVLDIFPPDAAKKMIEGDMKVLQDGELKTIETLQIKSGDTRIFETHKFRIDRENNSPLIGGFAIDITERKEMEDALSQSEELHRILIEHIPDGAFLSQDGILLFCNEALASMMGYTKDEVIGLPIPDLIAPEDREMVMQRQRNRLAGKSLPESYEFRLLHKDGETRVPVMLSVGTGMFKGRSAVIGTLHNMVNDRERESALRESEKKYRDIYNHAYIGLFKSTPEGRYISANPQAVHYLGYDSEEDLIQSVTDIGTQIYADTTERDEAFRLLKTQGFIENFETRFFRKDGSIIWGSISARIIRDENGTVVIEGTSLDINDRKEAEFARRESENRMRQVFESGILGVMFWNKDGQITDANDKFLEMLGYSREDLTAGLINGFALTPPEYAHIDEAAMIELMEFGIHRKPYEKEYIRKDGTRIPVVLAGAMIDEQQTKGVGFVLDITDRKRAETALCQTNHQLTLMTSIIRHDINNQISTLLSYLELEKRSQII